MFDRKNLPPEIASPLAPFRGEKPPAPDWFWDAIAIEPERSMVEAAGARIEMLTWGERGKPGLLLVHGASAHADWWSFIAPQLAADWRIAAVSLSGMGGSSWREAYSFETFAEELHACAQAAGLYDAPVKPIYIGHSFGGGCVYYAAASHPERMRATVLIDTGFGGRPAKDEAKSDIKKPPREPKTHNKIYPTLEAALLRFRFMPPQVPGNLYVADFIARRSLKQVDGGWTWRFDPMLFPRLDRAGIMRVVGKKPKKVVHIFGERSQVLARHGGRPAILGGDVKSIPITDSDHHIMVDQPLALVAALRSLLAVWP